ncbi:MAG: hypothetical protein GY909_00130 [Oligoflexia bacterium]|nr:hypothetical protein [Oligoflexia bacterium]
MKADAIKKILKTFKMQDLEQMKKQYGEDFVKQAIAMEMMSRRMASLNLDQVGRAPSTEEEKAMIDANRETELTLRKVQKDIVTESDTVTNGGNK